MGEDYEMSLTSLLDGLIWYRNNGLEPPWFTPSFCAGQPFFADPQSGYYSLLQLFSLLAKPVAASYLALLFSVSIAYWGGYLLMRRVFDTEIPGAILVGGLLMFNGFLPHRMIIGHLGFHGLALIPWLALLLLMPVKHMANKAIAALGAGLLLAYYVQGGMGTIILPSCLAIFALALLLRLYRTCLKDFFLRVLFAITVSLTLSAAKLSAAAALMSNVPRDYYPLPGVASPGDAIIMLLASLFLPSEIANEIIRPRLTNTRWTLPPIEWAYGFTLATGLLIAVLLIVCFRKTHAVVSKKNLPWLVLLLACMIWPLAYSTYSPEWNRFLKSLPVLGSASTPTRWMVFYIPFISIGTGLLLAHSGWSRQIRLFAVAASLLGTIVLTAIEPRSYYKTQNYDITAVLVADSMIRAGQIEPQIDSLGNVAELRVGDRTLQLLGSHTFLAGVSKTFCYNPLFGYRLEKFSGKDLRDGGVLATKDGFLNLKNPACYVFPQENGCSPGDRFRADQIEEARRFVSYKPFDFAVSARQKIANTITKYGLIICAGLLLLWVSWNIQRQLSRR